MGKPAPTTTTSSAPNPDVAAAYKAVMDRASGVAQTPYSPYTGQLTAGLSPDQTTASGTIAQAAKSATPNVLAGNQYYGTGADLISQGSGAVNPDQFSGEGVARFQNPYTDMVVNSTMGQIRHNNALQSNDLTSRGINAGNAFGGDRLGVAQAELARNQDIAGNQTISNLYDRSYQQAVQEFNNQQGVNLSAGQANMARLQQAGSTYGNLGQGIATIGQNFGNLLLNEGQAQAGLGATQQATQQAGLSAAQGQFNQAQAFPYSQTQWLSGIQSGLGSLSGGTSSTTGPAPNPMNQILGLGATAAGAFMSDERAKENIKPVGKLFDGQPIYSYNYKGHPGTQIGLIAQNVEKHHPEAVGEMGGLKTVNYADATEDAAHKGHFASGGSVVMPYAGGIGWIPNIETKHGAGVGIPAPPKIDDGSKSQQDMSKLGSGFGKAASNYYDNNPNPGSSSNPLPGLTADDYGEGFARGGFADGGSIDPDLTERISRLLSGGRDRGQRAFYNETRAGLLNSDTAPEGGSTYGGVGHGLEMRRRLNAIDAQNISDAFRSRASGGAVPRGFADGGSPFEDRLRGVEEAIASGDFDPVGANSTEFKAPGLVPMPRPRPREIINPDEPIRVQGTYAAGEPPMTPERAAANYAGTDDGPPLGVASRLPRQITGEPDELPPGVLAYNGSRPRGLAPDGPAPGAYDQPYVPPPEARPQEQGLFAGIKWALPHMSPEAGRALMAAGLSMMASRSPYLGVAAGEGGLAGLNAYGAAQTANREADVQERKLGFEQHRIGNEDARLRIAQEDARRTGATGDYIPDGKGGYILNPLVAAKAKTLAEINDKSKPVPVGRDGAGNIVYGIKQDDGTYKNAMTGQAFTQQEIPGATDGLTGEEFLNTLPPNERSLVKKLASYDMDPKDLSIKGGHRERLLAATAQYDPNFSRPDYSTRFATRKDFTSGKSSQNLTAFNTALGHMDTLDKSIDKLGNRTSPTYNRVTGAIQSEFDPKYQTSVKEFQTAKTAVIDELTRAFRGTGGNVHDLMEWEKAISAADSPEALHGAVKQAVSLLHSRIESVGDAYNRGMGTLKNPITLLSPKAQATLERLQGGKKDEAPAPGAPASAMEKTIGSKTYVKRGDQWFEK